MCKQLPMISVTCMFLSSRRRIEEDYLLTTSIRTHAPPGIRRWWFRAIKYDDIVVLEPSAGILLEDTAQKTNCANDGSDDERRGEHEQCDEHLGVDHDRPMTPRDACPKANASLVEEGTSNRLSCHVASTADEETQLLHHDRRLDELRFEERASYSGSHSSQDAHDDAMQRTRSTPVASATSLSGSTHGTARIKSRAGNNPLGGGERSRCIRWAATGEEVPHCSCRSRRSCLGGAGGRRDSPSPRRRSRARQRPTGQLAWEKRPRRRFRARRGTRTPREIETRSHQHTS